MNFLNLGIGEILLVLIIALIIFGPENLVKTARDAGVFIRKVSKSPYWQEVWATKRELDELPKIIAKEAQLGQTIDELDRETKGIKNTLSSSVSELIKEVNQPAASTGPATAQAKVESKPEELSEEKVELPQVEPKAEDTDQKKVEPKEE